MKIITKAFGLWLMVLVCSCYAQDNAPNIVQQSTDPGFSIVVAGPTRQPKVNEPLKVTITVTNTTNHVVYWSSDVGKDTQYTAFHYDLEQNGHEVETTFFHRKVTGRNRPGDPEETYSSSSVLLPHAPGKMFEMTIDLKRLYEISAPGQYTLQVSRYDEATKSTVRSNTIVLDIAP